MKDLIDRYLYAVGQKLPASQREDIKKELKSLILDEMDERVANQKAAKGEDYKETEQDVLEVLKSLGSPAEVAAKYKPSSRYLIGPELYELYRMLLLIVLGAVALGISISVVLSVLSMQGSYIELLYKLPMQLISAGISAVGSVTIVFALIQHFAPEERVKDMKLNKDWSPKELEPVPPSHEVVKLSDTIAAMMFTILVLVIFNGFPQIVAIYAVSNGATTIIPIFNVTVLDGYMRYLSIFLIGDVLLNIYKLKTGKWNTFSRFAQIGIDLGILVIVLMMIGNPGILNPGLNEAALGTDLAYLMKLIDIGSVASKIFIAVVILGTISDAVKHIYYTVKK